jgi:hypothetical protein
VKDIGSTKLEKSISQLEEKLIHNSEVLSEMMKKYVRLKKVLGRSEGRVGTPCQSESAGGLRLVLVVAQRNSVDLVYPLAGDIGD